MNDKATNLFGGKRRIVWFVIALLVIAGGLTWQISRSREPMPMYEGKPLSYWLECLDITYPHETSEQKAEHAIQAIGTNAIPTLLKMVEKKDSPLKNRLIALRRKERFLKIKIVPDYYYHALATYGFGVLGKDGRKGVPALIKILNDSDCDGCRNSAIASLGGIGPAAESAVPTLVRSLVVDTNYGHKLYIISALGEIHAHPEIAVPALTNCLADSRTGVREFTIKALGSFGTNAAQAIPILEKKLTDYDSGIQKLSLDALKRIDPKAAAQFEAETNHADSFQ